MGFRNEEEARLHRIQALETELEERDRKIAALEDKLAGKKHPKPPPKAEKAEPANANRRAGKNIPKVADLPEGDRWALPVHQPYMWVLGLGMILVSVGLGWRYGVQDGVPWLTVAAIGGLSCLPALYAFHRKYLILDKKAGTITIRNSLLGVPWSRVARYRGQQIRVKLRSVQPSDGNSYTVGDVFLGKTKLFASREERAVRTACSIAAFLELHYRGPRPAPPRKRRISPPERVLILGLTVALLVGAILLVRDAIAR